MPRKPKVPTAPIQGTAVTGAVATVYPPIEPATVIDGAVVDLHALDGCMVGSKLVSTEQGTVLATPEWERMLGEDDPASKLPRGARIQKLAEGVYRSVQLDAAVDKEALVTATAMEAVQQFRAHFHGD